MGEEGLAGKGRPESSSGLDLNPCPPRHASGGSPQTLPLHLSLAQAVLSLTETLCEEGSPLGRGYRAQGVVMTNRWEGIGTLGAGRRPGCGGDTQAVSPVVRRLPLMSYSLALTYSRRGVRGVAASLALRLASLLRFRSRRGAPSLWVRAGVLGSCSRTSLVHHSAHPLPGWVEPSPWEAQLLAGQWGPSWPSSPLCHALGTPSHSPAHRSPTPQCPQCPLCG